VLAGADEPARAARVKQRGAAIALRAVAAGLGAALPDLVSSAWQRAIEPVERLAPADAPAAPAAPAASAAAPAAPPPLDQVRAQSPLEPLPLPSALSPLPSPLPRPAPRPRLPFLGGRPPRRRPASTRSVRCGIKRLQGLSQCD
jgi:hypothetical protein